MKNTVPDMEIIHSVLNKHFNDTPVGGWAEEGEDGLIYIYNKDGSLYAFMPSEVWFQLLEYKEEKETL